MKSFLKLLGSVVVTGVAAGLGAWASVSAASFYGGLEQPSWAPPAWVFSPVWSALYVMMAVAAWLVWRAEHSRRVWVALGLFVAQLMLNALWSWLFFAWHRGALAFAEVLVLWGFIVATIIAFWRIRPVAGALLVPYLLWVTFAAALNFAVWRMNPERLG